MLVHFKENVMDITAQRIKELRQRNHLTQEELAKALGYSGRASICSLEKDAMNISVEKLMDMATYFAVPVSYLLGMDAKDSDYLNEYMLAMFKSLNAQGQKMAQEYLEMLVNTPKYKK